MANNVDIYDEGIKSMTDEKRQICRLNTQLLEVKLERDIIKWRLKSSPRVT